MPSIPAVSTISPGSWLAASPNVLLVPTPSFTADRLLGFNWLAALRSFGSVKSVGIAGIEELRPPFRGDWTFVVGVLGTFDGAVKYDGVALSN